MKAAGQRDVEIFSRFSFILEEDLESLEKNYLLGMEVYVVWPPFRLFPLLSLGLLWSATGCACWVPQSLLVLY